MVAHEDDPRRVLHSESAGDELFRVISEQPVTRHAVPDGTAQIGDPAYLLVGNCGGVADRRDQSLRDTCQLGRETFIPESGVVSNRHDVQIVDRYSCFREAVVDGRCRKYSGSALDPRKPFLLRGEHEATVPVEGCRGVVVVVAGLSRVYPEDPCGGHPCLLRRSPREVPQPFLCGWRVISQLSASTVASPPTGSVRRGSVCPKSTSTSTGMSQPASARRTTASKSVLPPAAATGR